MRGLVHPIESARRDGVAHGWNAPDCANLPLGPRRLVFGAGVVWYDRTFDLHL